MVISSTYHMIYYNCAKRIILSQKYIFITLEVGYYFEGNWEFSILYFLLRFHCGLNTFMSFTKARCSMKVNIYTILAQFTSALVSECFDLQAKFTKNPLIYDYYLCVWASCLYKSKAWVGSLCFTTKLAVWLMSFLICEQISWMN